MKTYIPNNTVSKDYKGVLNAFVERLVELDKSNIVSIFLTGSFARGEATETSDLDVWCVFKKINTETLTAVGTISQNLPVSYNDFEVNAQCLSFSEFNSCYFSNFLAYPIIYLEAILLWGNDIATKEIQDGEIEKTYKKFLAEVLLSIRHYITVNEPVEKLTFPKIKTWVLKPLMFALRLERYVYTKHYPVTISELMNAYDIPLKAVAYFMSKEKWETDIQSCREATLYSLNNEVEKFLMLS